MVTIMECGRLIRLAWINGALVRLSELQSQLESQKRSREAREDVSTAAKGSASSAQLYPQIAIDSVPTSK
jgi:hypothetical protein